MMSTNHHRLYHMLSIQLSLFYHWHKRNIGSMICNSWHHIFHNFHLLNHNLRIQLISLLCCNNCRQGKRPRCKHYWMNTHHHQASSMLSIQPNYFCHLHKQNIGLMICNNLHCKLNNCHLNHNQHNPSTFLLHCNNCFLCKCQMNIHRLQNMNFHHFL